MSDKASDNEASSVIPQDAAANAGGPQVKCQILNFKHISLAFF